MGYYVVYSDREKKKEGYYLLSRYTDRKVLGGGPDMVAKSKCSCCLLLIPVS